MPLEKGANVRSSAEIALQIDPTPRGSLHLSGPTGPPCTLLGSTHLKNQMLNVHLCSVPSSVEFDIWLTTSSQRLDLPRFGLRRGGLAFPTPHERYHEDAVSGADGVESKICPTGDLYKIVGGRPSRANDEEHEQRVLSGSKDSTQV